MEVMTAERSSRRQTKLTDASIFGCEHFIDAELVIGDMGTCLFSGDLL